MKKFLISNCLIIFLIGIIFYSSFYSLWGFIPILLIASLVLAILTQVHALTEFNKDNKTLLCIGNAITCIAIFFAELKIFNSINPPTSLFLSGLDNIIYVFSVGYINFCIVFPILLFLINTFKKQNGPKISYVVLIVSYLIMSLILEIYVFSMFIN